MPAKAVMPDSDRASPFKQSSRNSEDFVFFMSRQFAIYHQHLLTGTFLYYTLCIIWLLKLVDFYVKILFIAQKQTFVYNTDIALRCVKIYFMYYEVDF